MHPETVAIVHERFTELAGSEKVVEVLAEIWPDATLYAPIVDRSVLPAGLRDREIRTSSLQRRYHGGDYRNLLPLLPRALAGMDLGSPDLVIVSHHAFANRARVPTGAAMVSYTHTPARWIWDPAQRRMEGGMATRSFLTGLAATLRRSDRRAAAHPDRVIANSPAVADRVRQWWGREATVVFPPVDVRFYTPDPSVPREDFLLVSGRLVPYKRPDVAVAAATRYGWELVVAGDGRSRAQLQAEAGPNVRFVGRVSDEQLRSLYRRCRALLMPGVEDFGIVPVEAQACGAPVVALAEGGATASVVDGRTGILYRPAGDQDDVSALGQAAARLSEHKFDPVVLRAHAEQFGRERFVARFQDEVAALRG